MLLELKRAALFTLATMLLFGGAYPVTVHGLARLLFPVEADGSLLRRADGTILGSSRVAQRFTGPGYFHPRPSAVDWNAAASGGTNHGPSHPDHRLAVRERLDAIVRRENVTPSEVPAEMLTASGAGLDPHVPPAGAEIQVERVAKARGLDPRRVRSLVRAHTEPPLLGFYGRARVNVLELNLALDSESRPEERP